MEIIAITGILGVLAVIVLAVVRPWETGRLAAIYPFWAYRPAHGGGLTGPDVADVGQSAMSRWEYGIVGVDVCPRCGGPLASAPCSSCGWEQPPDRAPWPSLTGADRAALAAGLDRARAIAAEPRPAAVLLPAPTSDISGSGAPVAAPEPPAAEPAPASAVAPTDGASEPPGAWRGAYEALAPPEPELPPSGDWAPGTGPPEDDEPDQDEPEWTWQPSRLATPFDRALAAEVADALGDQNADAAVYIDRLTRGRREYVWQVRRGFLIAQGLAYP